MSFRINDADKQFITHNPELLAEGKYKEWFYQGMDKKGKAFLRAPAPKQEAPPADNQLIDFQSSQVRGWQRKAACAGADPGVFFVEEGKDPKRAYVKPDAEWRKYCPQCPVRESCLQEARESKSVGIFGGKVFAHPMSKSGNRNAIVEYDDTNLPKRGRPRTAPIKTSAERSKEYRDRIRATKARESLVTE